MAAVEGCATAITQEGDAEADGTLIRTET